MERFDVRVQPFEPRQEIEKLWQNFKSRVHGWENIPNLAHHLLKGSPPSFFNTWEVTVYSDDELVAFSIFDKGQNCIGSLEAAYDVKFRKFSLGIFTMQVELAYCIGLGLDYYYPGFYPKGISMFDYKLRPGNVEFFRQKESKWIPWPARNEDDWLLDEVLDKLKLARDLLKHYGFEAAIKVFNITNFPGIVPAVSDYNFLAVGENRLGNSSTLFIRIAWDPLKGAFMIFSKEIRKRTFLNAQLGKGKIASIGIPFYFDSSHININEVEGRVKKILANGR